MAQYTREEVIAKLGKSENLADADLSGLDLSQVKLKGANLQEANLQEANLMGANLVNANLEGTNLWRATLENATLDHAILGRSNITSAIVKNASINEIRGCSDDTINYLLHLGARIEKPTTVQEIQMLQVATENLTSEIELQSMTLAELLERFKSTVIPADPLWQGRNFEVEKELCFVLMPFKQEKHLQEIYNDHTKKIVEGFGLRCEKANDIFKNQMIMEDIWEWICKARFIIADLTDRNPNVFYELGLAHTLGKRVILITQNKRDVPFDLQHLRYIKYEFTPPGMEKFQKELTKAIKSIMKEANPVC